MRLNNVLTERCKLVLSVPRKKESSARISCFHSTPISFQSILQSVLDTLDRNGEFVGPGRHDEFN